MEGQSKPERPVALYLLFIMMVFEAASAMCGGAALIIKTDGSLLQMPLSWLRVSPFSNYLIPGIILFTVLGVFPAFTFTVLISEPELNFARHINLYKNRYFGWTCSLVTGFAIIIWIDIQVFYLGYGSPFQAAYVLLGLLILIFTLLPGVMKYYER